MELFLDDRAARAALHDVGGFMGQHLPVLVRILEIDDVFANGEAIHLLLFGIGIKP